MRLSLFLTSHTPYTVPLPCGRDTVRDGACGAYPVEKVEDANGEGSVCGPAGMKDIARRRRGRLDLPAYLLVIAFQLLWQFRLNEPLRRRFTFVYPVRSLLVVGRLKLPAFRTLSPELRTLGYPAARPGRSIWMSQSLSFTSALRSFSLCVGN